jgi:hypothetical protein
VALIDQHVGSLKHGIGEKRDRLAIAVLARLVLPLGHAVQPAHAGRAIEQPLQFGMGGHLRLVEQGRFVGSTPQATSAAVISRVFSPKALGSCGIEIAWRSARK